MPSMSLDELCRLGSIPLKHASGDGKGELVVAGTGLTSVRQISFEAFQYILHADVVFHGVCDPVTEVFILEHAKKSFDLRQLYDTHKPRIETYVQMAELMMRKVREGLLVVGLFYGHPGVFVNCTHRAIQIARDEGYNAKMLPGISAEDCLFADLGIDPSTPGCVTYEATTILFYQKPLDTTSHLVVWQVGAVGRGDMVFDNSHLGHLITYLEKAYGPDHPVIYYLSGVGPLEKTIQEHFKLCDFHRPEIAAKVDPMSTFYLPPKDVPQTLTRVDGSIVEEAVPTTELKATSALRLSHPDMKVRSAYGPMEKAAIAKLPSDQDDFVPPASFCGLDASPAMRNVVLELALKHHQLDAMEPEERARLFALQDKGLTDDEQFAVRECIAGRPDALMNKLRGVNSTDARVKQAIYAVALIGASENMHHIDIDASSHIIIEA